MHLGCVRSQDTPEEPPGWPIRKTVNTLVFVMSVCCCHDMLETIATGTSLTKTSPMAPASPLHHRWHLPHRSIAAGTCLTDPSPLAPASPLHHCWHPPHRSIATGTSLTNPSPLAPASPLVSCWCYRCVVCYYCPNRTNIDFLVAQARNSVNICHLHQLL